MKKTLVIFAYLLLAIPCQAKVITVDDSGPTDFHEIQAAINDANDGDEIIVSIGTYYENIDFEGKNITLRSTEPMNPVVVANTIIDGRPGGSVVTFSGTESPACVLSGFTVTNGRGTAREDVRGGGIYGNGTVATIQYNIISGNWAFGRGYIPGSAFGGGLCDCDGTIQCNIISGNETFGGGSVGGGGLFGCDGTIQNNVISSNSAFGGGVEFVGTGAGGGLCDCNGTIQNNTIFGNSGGHYGGGLSGCSGTIRNCIIWQNTADQGAQIYTSSTPYLLLYSGLVGRWHRQYLRQSPVGQPRGS